MAGYLIGGRFLSGLITIRQVLPRNASVELSMNAAESIDVGLTLPLVDPATGVGIDIPNQLLPARDFIGWVENGVVLAAGQIQGDPFTFPGASSIKAAGMGEYFENRYVLPVLAEGQLPRDVTSQWSGLSLGTIAKRLVEQALSHPSAGLPIDLPADVAGVHEREYPGSDGMRVGQALENLTNVDGGPDITFRPYLAEDRRRVRWAMLTGAPQLTQGGVDHYWDVSAPGPHAAVASLSRDGRDLASRSFLTGTTVRNMIPDGDFRDGLGKWTTGGVNGTVSAAVAGPVELALGAKGYSLSTWSGNSGMGAGGIASTPIVTVQEGQRWRVSVCANGTAKPVRLAVAWANETGEVGQTNVDLGTLTSAYQVFSGAVTVPAGISKMNVFLYPQTSAQWTAGNVLRTTAWMVHQDTEADLPFFHDELEIQARADNPALLDAGFPLMESWENRSSVLRESTLQAYADESVVRYSAHTETFTLRVKRDQHPKLGTYWPGDWAKIRIGKNPRIPADTYRVRIVRISFQAEGDVTIECAPERVAGGYPVPASNRAWLTDQLRALNARVDETNRG